MIEIKIKNDFAGFIRKLDKDTQKQARYAAMKALNSLAKIAQQEVKKEMLLNFDRPTPFTLNSTFIKYANKLNLTAQIYIKDIELAKSKSLAESIGHQFSGGSRLRKRLEYWLEKAGYISGNEFVVPGAGADLDQYGNMRRGQIQKVLSQLSAGSDAASYRSGSARSKSKRAVSGYFWSRGGKLKRGVWMRVNFASGSAVKPVLLVVQVPKYRQRINMEAIGVRVVDRDFGREFNKEFAQAMATAR